MTRRAPDARATGAREGLGIDAAFDRQWIKWARADQHVAAAGEAVRDVSRMAFQRGGVPLSARASDGARSRGCTRGARAAGGHADLGPVELRARREGRAHRGQPEYKAHEEREAGFLHVIDEMFPKLEVVGLREGQEDAAKNYRQTRALLEQHPDMGGIYNIGDASDGVARALKEAGREQKVVFIGHGLTPGTCVLLIDGSMDAVITQSPHTTLMSCLRIFTNLRDKRETLSGVETTRSQVIFRENLP